jgi:hypothetical protein
VLPQRRRRGHRRGVDSDSAIDVTAEACPSSGSDVVTEPNASIATEGPRYESASIHANGHTVTGLADGKEGQDKLPPKPKIVIRSPNL